jgi:hypothetical protein
MNQLKVRAPLLILSFALAFVWSADARAQAQPGWSEFFWSCGQAPTTIYGWTDSHLTNGYCFTVEMNVGGSPNDSVGLYLQQNSTGAYDWVLNGTSSSSCSQSPYVPDIEAICIPFSQLLPTPNDGAATWQWQTAPGSNAAVGTWSNWAFCNLQGMAFDGLCGEPTNFQMYPATSETVHTILLDTQNVPASGPDRALGSCMDFRSRSPFYPSRYNPANPLTTYVWGVGDGVVQMGPTSSQLCALSAVQVATNMGSGYMGMFVFPEGGYWQLYGWGNTGFIEAECIDIPQVIR